MGARGPSRPGAGAAETAPPPRSRGGRGLWGSWVRPWAIAAGLRSPRSPALLRAGLCSPRSPAPRRPRSRAPLPAMLRLLLLFAALGCRAERAGKARAGRRGVQGPGVGGGEHGTQDPHGLRERDGAVG